MDGRLAARAAFQLTVLFFVGLVVGIWTFIAPWVVGFPSNRPGAWTSSTWSTVWVGAIVVAASVVGLLTALGLALSSVLRPAAARPSAQEDRQYGR
jgi:hypothetical protein